MDEDFDFASFGEMDHHWEHTVKPQKKTTYLKEREKEFRRAYIQKQSVSRFNKDSEDLVLKNVYQDQYGLPNNLEVRPPDRWVRKAVKDSYVFERTKLLQQYSIDPNLVFFHHELEDLEVGQCIQRLHGEHLEEAAREDYKKKLRFISQKLADGIPEMMLMFGNFKEFMALAPGFIHVPTNFEVEDLNQYLKENLEDHRYKSAKFTREYKDFEEIEKEV